MPLKVLVEEKKPEPPKKLPAKPEAIAVPVEEPPKKGIDSHFVFRVVFCCIVSFLTSHTFIRNT